MLSGAVVLAAGLFADVASSSGASLLGVPIGHARLPA
jgi:hypothetical protein